MGDDDVEAAAVRAGEEADRAEVAADRAQVSADAATESAEEIESSFADLVDPHDPLLDTSVRRLHAGASPEAPYGRPGAPLNRRSPFGLAFVATTGVLSAVLVALALVNVRGVLVLILIAAFLAIGLNPAIERLTARGMRRGGAVGVVFAGVILFFVGFGFAVVPPIIDQANAFVDKVPEYLTQLEANPTVAELNARFAFLDRAQALLTQPQTGTQAFGGILGLGKFVFSLFFSSLTVLVLTLYFTSSFPTIKNTAYLAMPRSRRARVGLLTDEILDRVGGYVAGALSIAGLAGVTTFLFAEIAGIPYPLALALVVAVLDLVPLVGATIGAVLVTAVAFFVSVPVGVASIIFYLIYQQVENYLIYPKVMQRSVDVSPAATVVAVLIGGSLLGVLGALLAIPVTAAVQLVLSEVVVPRQDRS